MILTTSLKCDRAAGRIIRCYAGWFQDLLRQLRLHHPTQLWNVSPPLSMHWFVLEPGKLVPSKPGSHNLLNRIRESTIIEFYRKVNGLSFVIVATGSSFPIAASNGFTRQWEVFWVLKLRTTANKQKLQRTGTWILLHLLILFLAFTPGEGRKWISQGPYMNMLMHVWQCSKVAGYWSNIKA